MRYLAKFKKKRRDDRLHKTWYNNDLRFVGHIDLPELTTEEMAQIQKAWTCFDWKKEDFLAYRAYKKFRGFSPYYVGGYQSSFIWKALNPRELSSSLSNKAYMDFIFPEVPFPKTFVRGITGNMYDADMNFLTLDEAVGILASQPEFIIKPSVIRSYGDGVMKMTAAKDYAPNTDKIKDALMNAGPNFVVQEVLHQHPVMAELNPSSVNSCRITSLYIDGRYGFSVGLRIGKQGSYIDNWRQGYYIGVSETGVINDFGYDIKMNPIRETDTHIAFGGIQIPGFDKMAALVEYVHKKYFPMCGVIGWDMMAGSDGEPHIIEFNLRPDFFAEQIGSGAFFEPYCDAICEKIESMNDTK